MQFHNLYDIDITMTSGSYPWEMFMCLKINHYTGKFIILNKEKFKLTELNNVERFPKYKIFALFRFTYFV